MPGGATTRGHFSIIGGPMGSASVFRGDLAETIHIDYCVNWRAPCKD